MIMFYMKYGKLCKEMFCNSTLRSAGEIYLRWLHFTKKKSENICREKLQILRLF